MTTLLTGAMSLLAAALLVFIAANLLAHLVLARFWERLQPEFRRATFDMWSRYAGPLKADAPRWYGLKDWEDFLAMAEEFRETGRAGNLHEPFTEWRSAPFQGTYWNYAPEGYRLIKDQGPWPPDPANCNVLFFGGSTAVNQGPDWTSIASYMQEILRQALPGRRICLYNFGRTAFFSTQEVILYHKLLEARPAHAAAVFFHGTNDFHFHNGNPATFGLFSNALEASNRNNWTAYSWALRGRPKWPLLIDFLRYLPLLRLIDLALDKRNNAAPGDSSSPLTEADLSPEENSAVVERLMHNHRTSVMLAEAYGARALTVIQPVPAYRYDLSLHRALGVTNGLGLHAYCRKGYEQLRPHALKPEDDHLLWLADIQEQATDCLYLDGVHYTADFSRVIAGHICAHLLERGFLDQAGAGGPAGAAHAV